MPRLEPEALQALVSPFARGGSFSPQVQEEVDDALWHEEINHAANSIVHSLTDGDRWNLARMLRDPRDAKVLIREIKFCLGISKRR